MKISYRRFDILFFHLFSVISHFFRVFVGDCVSYTYVILNEIKATPDMNKEEDLYEVVISGISGKFPLSDDVEQFKENLLSKQNLVTEDDCRWNKDKWEVPSATGKISVVKKFDDTFFGIYSGVAAMMDPLTRVTIERAFEAIMDAGMNPKALRGSNTAVYTASSTSDSEAIGCDEKLTAKFWLLAHVRALLANRISYVLNLTGPSWTVDATWVGGIYCLKQAVHDIRRGHIENALVGVSNVILFPEISQHWVGLGKLSPDGSCLSFDDKANGYGRSEAVVFLFLQRENEANRVYGKIPHVDSSFFGDEADTLLKPQKGAFVNFLEKFYSTPGIAREDVAYLEADGSGDKYFDEIELNAIGDVLCGKSDGNTLLVGSVKNNAGHTEAAAPFVSLTKALISLDSEIIPPNKYFYEANKNIQKLQTKEMKIVMNATKFPENHLAAVNAIGLCSSIGHVILKQHRKKKTSKKDNFMPHLVLVSARHEHGLFNIIKKLECMPYDPEYFSLVNNVFKESMTGHFFRGFTILGATEKKMHFTLEIGTPPKRQVWFVFAGMGSQWPGMGADLMNIPIFAASMKELHSYLAPLGVDIIDVICNNDPMVLKNVVHSFVGIVAVQIGLVDVLKALDIKPDGMFGHSLGENMCAYADGCFSKYQTIMAAYYRGKASMEINVRKGLMASVGLSHEELRNLPPNVEVACHNADDNCTISGPLEEVQLYLEELKRQNVFVRAVNSNNVAYHSKQVLPLAPFVLENISKIVPNPKKRSSRWISTSIPECNWDSPLAETSSAEYHVNNFLGTVYFAEACAHIPEDSIVIEISPHGLFQGILKRMLQNSSVIIPLGKRETSNSLNFLLNSIGKLYVVGLQPNVNAIYPPIQYPVSRGTPSLASLATWNHETDWEIKKYQDEMKIKPLKICLRETKWRFLADNKVNEKVILPFSIPLVETLQAYDVTNPVLVFEKINIFSYVEVSANDVTVIYTQVQHGSGNFEIVINDRELINGIVRFEEKSITFSIDEDLLGNIDDNEDDRIMFSADEIRNIFKQYLIEISEPLCSISSIVFIDDGCLATVVWNDSLAYFINSIMYVKVFYDLCLGNTNPLLPRNLLKFAIETEKYSTIETGTSVKMIYSGSRNIFSGPGFEMIGLENSYQLPHLKERKLQFQDLQFVPHNNPQTINAETFLNICGQIMGETFSAQFDSERSQQLSLIKILLINDFDNDKEITANIMFLLETLYKELPHVLIDAKCINEHDLKIICQCRNNNGRYVVICKKLESYLEIIEPLASKASNVVDIFLLTFNKITKVSNNFISITEQETEKYDIMLWKKKVSVVDCVIKIKPSNNEHWLTELQKDLYEIKSQREVLIQWNSDSTIEILEVVNQISKTQPTQLLRYFVKMNEEQSLEYKYDLQNYRQQLEKGLILNVHKDGEWGSIRRLLTTHSFSSASNLQNFIIKNKHIPNVNVEYIATCETSYSMKSQKLISFAGMSLTDHKKVMGMATSNLKFSPRSEILFQWSVPDHWSLEDSVTVPVAYVKVYYALIVKGKLCSKSSVFVHSGCTTYGEAAITIALNFDCKVYTSISNTDEAEYLRERFENSSCLNFVYIPNNQIDVEILKLTEGKGVDIIINANCPNQLQQTIRCLKYYGCVLQLSKAPLLMKNTLGMSVFLKSTSVHSILDMEVLERDESVKAKVYNWLFHSIETNLIRPFKKVFRYSNEIETAKNTALPMIIKQEVNSNSLNADFFCDPDKSYLVIGTKNEIWLGIVTWLLKHNAKKIILIENERNNFYDQCQKRFSLLLQNYFDLYLTHISWNAIKNEEEAASMIQDVNKFAEIDAVYCLCLDSQECLFIDYGLRKHVPNARQLIFLQSDGSKVCESRLRNSLPALNVYWDRNITDTAVLISNINKIILNSLRISSSSLYISDTSQFIEKLEYSLQRKESQFFPKYSEVRYFFDSFSKNADFEKITSKCPEYNTRTQLFPIFILPGLHKYKLKKLIRKLMYPVYCARFPISYSSVTNVAESLIKHLKEIQPVGPYTIVGESWSGAIAIELVSLLEKKDKVKLILLEGIPNDMRNKLLSMGSFGSQEFLYNLHELCFENKQNDDGQYLENEKLLMNKDRTKFLELLQRKLTITYNYSPKNAFIQSEVIAIKLATESVLNTYIDFEKCFGQDLDVKILNEVEYVKLIDSNMTANIINENVLFKW